jgi:uncharacterized protein (DUF983 family)
LGTVPSSLTKAARLHAPNTGSGALFQTLILIGMYFYYSDYCKVCGRDGGGGDVVI